MALGPTLETERLILRPPVQDDLDGWTVFSGDPECMRYIGGAQQRDGAWRSMAVMTGSWALLGYGMFAVIEKASGEMIGRLGPWQPGGESCGWPGTEVGWGLVRSAWGKGFAQEGSAAAMDWVVDHLGWTDIIHTISPLNVGSQKVAIALGSRNRGPGVLPPPMPPGADARVDIWGQSAAEWRARRGRTHA